MTNNSRFDLILENGGYLPGVSGAGRAAAEQGKRPVVYALRLSGCYRLPLLGTLLRNHWAKRHGAILQTIKKR